MPSSSLIVSAVSSGGLTISGATVTVLSGGVTSGFSFLSDTHGGSVTAEYVSSGGSAVTTLLSAGTAEYVYSGGISVSATNLRGAVKVFGGGVESGTIDQQTGAFDYVSSGGLSISGLAEGGGTQIILSGGVARFTSVGVDGTQIVSSGGTTSASYVSGSEIVTGTNAVASGTTILFGGELYVWSGGLAIAPVVRSGGYLALSAGVASNAVISSGANELISSGGIASNTVVAAGGALGGSIFVANGGESVSAVIGSAGAKFFEIQSGGTATGTVIDGALYIGVVSSGGSATGTVISGTASNQAGNLSAHAGGSITGTTITYGSLILFGGSATSTTLNIGGYELVSSGGLANATTITKSGFLTISSGGTATGTIVASGGLLTVSGGGSIANTTLLSGGAIDLAYLPWVSGGSISLNSNTDVLTVVENGVSATLQLAGGYAGQTFHTAAMGGTTEITVTCFRAGTRIRTERGEVPVEQLAVGDLVITGAGALKPIRWIGHREVNCAAHPKPANVWPVRIAAGAFADGQPSTGLDLSPDHAVLIAGSLVPIRALINGTTIRQIRADTVRYYHIELDAHDILLAENLPTESFLDAGNRHSLANGGVPVQLHPLFTALSWESACAPLLLHGETLDRIRTDLARRAAATDRCAIA